MKTKVKCPHCGFEGSIEQHIKEYLCGKCRTVLGYGLHPYRRKRKNETSKKST